MASSGQLIILSRLADDVEIKSIPFAVAQSCAACNDTTCRCEGKSVFVATRTAFICLSLSCLFHYRYSHVNNLTHVMKNSEVPTYC